MKTTYQYRLELETAQKLTLNKWLRTCRYLYNRMLGDRCDWWDKNRCYIDSCPLICYLPELRDKPNYFEQKKQLPILKKDLIFIRSTKELVDLSEVYSTVLQDVCDRAKKRGSRSRRKLAKREGRLHQKIARSRKDFQYKSAHKLVRTGKKVFFYEQLNLQGLTKRNKPKQDEARKFLPNKQSAKSGLNKSWLDAGFGQFFSILEYIAAKAGAVAIEVNPAYTSQLLAYRDEFVFTDGDIRIYWDEEILLNVDRDINAAINIKRVGLDLFPTIKRRRGNPVVVTSTTNSTSKEALIALSRVLEASAVPSIAASGKSLHNSYC